MGCHWKRTLFLQELFEEAFSPFTALKSDGPSTVVTCWELDPAWRGQTGKEKSSSEGRVQPLTTSKTGSAPPNL